MSRKRHDDNEHDDNEHDDNEHASPYTTDVCLGSGTTTTSPSYVTVELQQGSYPSSVLRNEQFTMRVRTRPTCVTAILANARPVDANGTYGILEQVSLVSAGQTPSEWTDWDLTLKFYPSFPLGNWTITWWTQGCPETQSTELAAPVAVAEEPPATTTTTAPPATTTTTQPIATIEILDSASGSMYWPSLAIAPNGNPGVSYRHPDGLKFAACTDSTCASASLVVLDSGAGGNGGTSLVYNNQGYPLVAYHHLPETGLKVATCTSACSHPQVTYWIDIGLQTSTGGYPAVALKSDGTPFVGHVYASAGDIRLANCLQSDCSWFSNGNNSNGVGTVDYDGNGAVAVANTVYGPLVVYWQTYYKRLRAAQCTSIGPNGCTAWNFSDLDSDISNNPYPSIALGNNGRPVIAYYDVSSGSLNVVTCSSYNCSPGIGNSQGSLQTVEVVDSGGNVGTNSSIAIQGSGNPVIAYYDITNGTLKVAACTTASCSGAVIKTIGPADDSGRMSLAIGNDGTPLVAYIDNNSLKVARVPVG